MRAIRTDKMFVIHFQRIERVINYWAVCVCVCARARARVWVRV